MKLSCSAYQAGSSYAQKILTGHPQNYGATSSTNVDPSGDGSHGITMPTWTVEEIEGKCSPNDTTTEFGAEVTGGYQQHGGGSGHVKGSRSSDEIGGGGGGESSRKTSSSLSHQSDGNNPDQKGNQSDTSISKAPATSSCSPSDSPAHRSKSNQRWMKLRTTVQLSGAIQTIQQKKAPLKREDSFLKRFSTRQVPEAQETFEIGDDDDAGGDGGEVKKLRKRRRSLPRSVVNPDGNFYFYWLMVLTSCVLYNLWTLIVRQSFPELQAEISLFWILSDAFSDLVFLLDIAVQFRTGYLEQGLMVYQTKKLAKHYVGSKPFYLDLFSLLPTDLFQIYFGVNPMFRFPRFLKVYRIYNYYYMVESRTVFPNVWRVVNLVHILLLLAHWFGCFYYLLSEAEGFPGYWGYPNPHTNQNFTPLTRKYLGSLYWSTLTLTTIGDLPPPDTNAQYIFTIASYLIGVFIFATIVGQVGNVITNRNANRLEFERLLDGAKMYMRHHKVPRDMQRRVLRWYDYSWSRGRIQGGGDINTALGLLPDKLKTELALHVNLSVLKKVTIFQECQPEFLHDLVLKMKAYIFTPGDLICRKGEVAREMFIIADGILEVISETGRVLTTMQAGDFFGEIGILNLDGLNKRTADVRSVGYSELFSLSREDVLAAMKDYPEAQDILQTLGRKRLMEARKASGPQVKKGAIEIKKVSPVHTGLVHTGLVHSQSTYSQKDFGDSDSNAGKRIVEKLKDDVKGLRNAIRRSRRSNSSKDDSSEPESGKPDGEMESSSNKKRKESTVSVRDAKSFPPPRGVLKRMHNVVLSDEKEPSSPSASSPTSKSVVSVTTKRVQLPSVLSSIASTSKQEPEVLGAGLPLIQRLRLLRQKEERERKQQEEREQMMKALIPSNLSMSSPSASPLMQTKASVETRAVDIASMQRSSTSSADSPVVSSPATTSSVPLLGTFGAAKSTLLIGEAAAAAVLKVTAESKSALAGPSFPPVWTASPPRVPGPLSESQGEEPTEGSSLINSTSRPSALQLRQKLASKHYGSVEDLSPEFSRLPFIKKLKILNERQKIAELLMTKSGNSVLTRSTSEGSNENQTIPGETPSDQLHAVHLGRRAHSNKEQTLDKDDMDKTISAPPYFPLTESHDSEPGSFIATGSGDIECLKQPTESVEKKSPSDPSQKKRRRRRKVAEDGNEGSTEDSSPSPPPLPESDGESNETPERRTLKSILKKLTGTSEVSDVAGESSRKDDQHLLKAQTVEGYAARHLPLDSSIVLQAVSQTTTTTTTTATLERAFSPENLKALGSLLMLKTEDVERTHPQQGLNIAQEECVGSVVLGIKTIIQSKLEEIHNHFQSRFETLEFEVRQRDDLISLLQQRIQELEDTQGVETRKYNHMDYATRHGTEYEDNTSEEESLEYQRAMAGHPLPHPLQLQSSYLFGRGDSIDTVVGAQDIEDEVFEEHSSGSSTGRRRGSGDNRSQNSNYASTWAEEQDAAVVTRSEEVPAPWQLEFHRDRDSLPPPNGTKGESIALDIGNTSTEYESESSEEEEDVQLQETKVPLDESDDDEEEEEDSDQEGTDHSAVARLDHKNWEVQLLAKEMEKREEQKKVTTQTSTVVNEMRELENEIEEMKEAVSKGSLSPEELDMLESLLQTKTRRMKVLCKALSVESGQTTALAIHSGPPISPKSKVGKSYDEFPGTKEPRRPSFLDVHKLFSRSGGPTGERLKRQSSLYERTKGKSSSVSPGRRESAGAIFMGGAAPGDRRKLSFLSRLNTVTRQFTGKYGSQKSEDESSYLKDLDTRHPSSKEQHSITTTSLTSPISAEGTQRKDDEHHMISGSGLESSEATSTRGAADSSVTPSSSSNQKQERECDQPSTEESQPLLKK